MTTAAEMPSEESKQRCLSTVLCQTDEDPNKAVIDKLRKRIDDLEEDLRETKEKLNIQQTGPDVSHPTQDNGNILTFDKKDKFQKFITSLSEQLKKKIGKVDVGDEQIQKYVEKNEFDCGYKLEELRKKLDEKRRSEIEEIKNDLEMKHSKEMSELCEKLKIENKNLMEDLRRKSEDKRKCEVQEAKTNAKKLLENELKKNRDTSRVERETIVSGMDREQASLRESICETKRKQWCCNCWQEAYYPCCWNTSYCSRQCQVIHWQQHRLHCNRNFAYLGQPARS